MCALTDTEAAEAERPRSRDDIRGLLRECARREPAPELRVSYTSGRTLYDRDTLLMRDAAESAELRAEQCAQTYPTVAKVAAEQAAELRAELATRDLAGAEERARRGIGLPPCLRFAGERA